MARLERRCPQAKEEWSYCRMYVIVDPLRVEGCYVPEYSPPPGIVMLMGTSLGQTPGSGKKVSHPCLQWQPLAQCLFSHRLRRSETQVQQDSRSDALEETCDAAGLLEGRWDRLYGKVSCLYILDYCKLKPFYLDEMATPLGYGPVLKPIVRLLQKLNLQQVTLAAVEIGKDNHETENLLLKLLKFNSSSPQPLPVTDVLIVNISKPDEPPSRKTSVFSNAGSNHNEQEQTDEKTRFIELLCPFISLPDLTERVVGALNPNYSSGVGKEEEAQSDGELTFLELEFTLNPVTKQMDQSTKYIKKLK